MKTTRGSVIGALVLSFSLIGALNGAKDCDVNVDEPITLHVVVDDAGNATVSQPSCDAGAPDVGDAGQSCGLPPGRIVLTGDSRMGWADDVANGQLNTRNVENQYLGGMTTSTLPDVSGPPATVIVGIGVNDLKLSDGGISTVEEINARTAAWVARQVARGHVVRPALTIPKAAPAGAHPSYETTRRAVNAHRVALGAEPVAADPRIGDEANTADLSCYGADQLHLTIECYVRHAQYVVRALTQCAQGNP